MQIIFNFYCIVFAVNELEVVDFNLKRAYRKYFNIFQVFF